MLITTPLQSPREQKREGRDSFWRGKKEAIAGLLTPYPSVPIFEKSSLKNPVRKRLKIQFFELGFPTWFLKNQVQMDRA